MYNFYQDRVQQAVIKTINNCTLKTNSACLIQFLQWNLHLEVLVFNIPQHVYYINILIYNLKVIIICYLQTHFVLCLRPRKYILRLMNPVHNQGKPKKIIKSLNRPTVYSYTELVINRTRSLYREISNRGRIREVWMYMKYICLISRKA